MNVSELQEDFEQKMKEYYDRDNCINVDDACKFLLDVDLIVLFSVKRGNWKEALICVVKGRIRMHVKS